MNLEGSISGIYRGRTVHFDRPGLFLLEPGETHHSTRATGPADFHVLFFPIEHFNRSAEEHGLRGERHFRLAQAEDERLSGAIGRFARSLRHGGTPLEQQSWFAMCLHGMHRFAESKPWQPDVRCCSQAVRRAVEILRERYRDPVDLEELAAWTGLNRFSLVHAFTHQVGVPPHAFQILIRIERARMLLALGHPPAMVAVEVGFSDQSHFHRHFKHHMQVTPGQYAQQP